LSTPTVDDQPRGPALTGIADFGKSPPQFDGSTCKIPFVKKPVVAGSDRCLGIDRARQANA
jgi:hypothetical protein